MKIGINRLSLALLLLFIIVLVGKASCQIEENASRAPSSSSGSSAVNGSATNVPTGSLGNTADNNTRSNSDRLRDLVN